MMSKGRMDDLLRLLEADGWVLLNPQEMFAVENEVVDWKLEQSQTKTILDIDFHIFGDLGERSDSLTDILYCLVRNQPIKLYFEKRESEKWRQSLITFVEGIRSSVRPTR